MLAQSYTAETVGDSLKRLQCQLHSMALAEGILHVKKQDSFALILEKENW